MQLSDFYFELPDELIARFPAEKRTDARLLNLKGKTGEIKHQTFLDMLALITEKDLLIFNNTKVIPARLLGQKESGGKVEVLVERVISDHHVIAHVRSNKKIKPGTVIMLEGVIKAEMVRRHDDLFELKFLNEEIVYDLLEAHGHMPLPPYIDRSDEASDKDRYQTVYGQVKGAVAAPTAGLHFDDTLLQKIKDKGAAIEFVTLHVGAGTFQSVRVDNITDHVMHSEYAVVSERVVNAIKQTKAKGGRVIAIGTTSVRSLESAAKHAIENGIDEVIAPYQNDTQIFIYPGYEFKVVDAMFTNFHLPESTLIMLVSAFAGKENILNAYKAAVQEKYRFFSYGDSMFLEKA